MPTLPGGGAEGPSVPAAVLRCLAWDCSLSAGTCSSSSWHLLCCEASTPQRGAGKSPSASPRPCPKPLLMLLRFFPTPPSTGRGYPQPSQAAQQWWQTMAVGACSCQLPAGTTLGGCLKKHLALPKPNPTEASAHSWASREKNKREIVFLPLKRRESKVAPSKAGEQRENQQSRL